MSDKPFATIEKQLEILKRRGVVCDERTRAALMREGYYAIVNGYKGPFLDAAASAQAKEDRYLPGTTFADIYMLFRFDRDLRALTFRSLMMVETMLRSLMSYSFSEVHKATEAYLKPGCYTDAANYLRGERRHAGDLEWMVDMLERHARGVEADEPGGGDGSDVRVAYYRDVHGGVPLWVLFTELSFGNLKYFFALMKPEEQKAVCRRLAELCGGDVLARNALYDRLEVMVDARNICAHEERLYNAKLGEADLGFAELAAILRESLPEPDKSRLDEDFSHLLGRYRASFASQPARDVLDELADSLG